MSAASSTLAVLFLFHLAHARSLRTPLASVVSSPPRPRATRAKPALGASSTQSYLPPAEWRPVFDRLDSDHDGALSFPEVGQFVDHIAPDEPAVRERRQAIFSSYDCDNDGHLDFEEAELMLKASLRLPTDSVLQARERYSSSSLWLSSMRNFQRSTVLQAIMAPLLGIASFSLAVAITHHCSRGLLAQAPFQFGACMARGGVKVHSLLGGALSLLLVFRTNTAYGRFWEARKIWEQLGNRCRELARFAFLYQDVFQPAGVELTAKLLVAFPVQLRRHLIGASSSDTVGIGVSSPEGASGKGASGKAGQGVDGYGGDRLPWLPWQSAKAPSTVPFGASAAAGPVTFEKGPDIRSVTFPNAMPRPAQDASQPLGPLPPKVLRKLRASRNRPLHLCRQLGMLVRDLPDSDRFSSRERLKALDGVDKLGSYVGACERLVQTPVPLNYARHTSRFLTLWCLTLPLSLVADMGFLVVPVTAFVTWCLFGIQEIGA